MTPNGKNLYAASRQWASRPADERFWDLASMYEQTKQYASECVVKPINLAQCEVRPFNGQDLALYGPKGNPAHFQHHSFQKLAQLAKAPAEYLRELPAELVAASLNYGFKQHASGERKMLLHVNGGLHIRGLESNRYQRVWNYEICDLALRLESQGWRTPPARPCGLAGVPEKIATEEDCLKYRMAGLGIKPGDMISPAGLYASDHDCFIFQVNEDYPINGGNGEQLFRGVIWTNSEIAGERKWRGTMFLYEGVCGNHIIWGAQVVAEIEMMHVGNVREVFRETMINVTERAKIAASEDETRIRSAKRFELAPAKDQVIDLVYRKGYGLSQKQCQDAYVMAERFESEHGDNPRSAWGYAAGLTRLSQGLFADQRNMMDRAAGKVLALAF